MMGTIAVLLVFGGLIFFHELGHFLVARCFSIGVKTFSLGFGPAIVSKTWGKTTYQIAAVPLGGFVALVGETPDADIPAPFTKADSFSLHPAWQRFLVAAAGSVFNLLLAWLICWGLVFSYGKMDTSSTVGAAQAESPAAAVLQKGDIIRSINGTPVSLWTEISPLIRQSKGAPLALAFTRGENNLSATITPLSMGENWVIGISPNVAPVSFFSAAKEGIVKAYELAKFILDIFSGLLSRKISTDDVGGPIGIAQMIYQQANEGLRPLLLLAAFLSVNLGVLNLLPIPVLDGGHLFFLSLEMIFRRPVPLFIQEKAMMAGMCLLLMLMLFATYNDVVRLAKNIMG